MYRDELEDYMPDNEVLTHLFAVHPIFGTKISGKNDATCLITAKERFKSVQRCLEGKFPPRSLSRTACAVKNDRSGRRIVEIRLLVFTRALGNIYHVMILILNEFCIL